MARSLASAICLLAVLYANYGLVGVGQIAVAQHLDVFMLRFDLDAAGVAYIVAGTGFGRAIGYCIGGFLSDRFGRRPLVFAGSLGLAASFAGLFAAPTPQLAFAAVFLGGLSDSALDAGTHATLAEAFPKSAASGIIGTKISISAGQVVFPLLVAFLAGRQLPFAWAFACVAAVALLNALAVLRIRFPHYEPVKGLFKVSTDVVWTHRLRRRPRLVPVALPFFAFAACSYACFGVVMVWMPYYSRMLAGADLAQSVTTVSFFAAGSIAFGLFSMAVLRRRVRPVLMMVALPCVTAAAALTAWAWPTLGVCRAVSFVIGASAAGGVLQTGLAVLIEIFPGAKARMSAAYLLASSLTGALTTVGLGAVARCCPSALMLVNAAAGLLCVAAGLMAARSFYRVFQIDPQDRRLGEACLLKWLGW